MVASHPHNGSLEPCHEDLETNLMSRNSLTWDHCKDSSSQVPRSPDRAELRASARRAFIREDCGRRVARAVLRKAAPLVGEYATGDIVCYRKEDQGWSPACRLIGFDGNKTAWLICAGTPVCAAVDRLRPTTSAEAFAMQFAQDAKYEPGHPEDQQAFVDARASLNHDEDELVEDSLEDRPVLDTNDPETPHSLWNQSSSVATRRRRPDHAVARNC